MRKVRKASVLLAAVAMAVSLAVPAVAQGPKHKSCQDFGHLFAEFGQNPEAFGVSNAGEGISFNARNEVELFGQTFTPPGSIAAIVHFEQNELGFCEPA